MVIRVYDQLNKLHKGGQKKTSRKQCTDNSKVYPYQFSFTGTDCQTLFNITSDGVIKTISDLDRDDGILLHNYGDCILNVTVKRFIVL